MFARIAALAVAALARISERCRLADDSGASLLEYVIVLGMVSVAAIVALTIIGHNTSQTLTGVAGSIAS